jgi:hypothetical protein
LCFRNDPLNPFKVNDHNDEDDPEARPPARTHLEIDTVHPTLNADDACHQTDIAAALVSPWVHLPSNHDIYGSMPIVAVPLSCFEDYYINCHAHSAANLLCSHIKIIVDAKYSLNPTSDHVILTIPTDHLDYHLTVSDGLGLLAIIPNQAANHNFAFRLDLHKLYWHFNDSSGLLGFDPAALMLFIGYHGQDEAWIGMAPDTIDDLTELPEPGFKSGSTHLSRAHYRMLISFFAFILAKNTNRAFPCHDVYGIDLSVKEPRFQDYFTIMFVVPSLLTDPALTGSHLA